MNERAPGFEPEETSSVEARDFDETCRAVGLTAEETATVSSRPDRDAFLAKMTASSVRMLRGLLRPDWWGNALEKTKGGLFRMADENRDKLRPLVDAGIVMPGTIEGGDFVQLCELSGIARKNVLRAAEVAGVDVARSLATADTVERVDFDGPDGESLRAVLEASPRMLARAKDLDAILSKENPVAWLRERRALLDPLRGVWVNVDAWRHDSALLEGNDLFLRALGEGSWSDGAKAVALVEFGHWDFGKSAWADIGELKGRLDFWAANVHPSVLSPDTEFSIRSLLTADLLFLRTMREMLTDEQWEEATSEPEAAAHFKKFEFPARATSRISAEEFATFAERDSIPVESDPGEERRAEELRDILVASGLEPMTRRVSPNVRATVVAGGSWSNGSYDLSTGEISAAAVNAHRKSLPAILFHETGHGIQNLLATTADGKALNARFAIATAIEPQTHSSYAESFRVRDEKNLDGYVSESFAEDFRLFFFAPERLPPLKRETIGRVVATTFPSVDAEDVRRRTRSVMGNYYGVSVLEEIQPTSCENAKWKARRADRIDHEDARDKERGEE
ncbi:MAG: hypothetical protein WCO25_04595 [Candidatus Uhrbacteria bacterium]